MPPRPFPYPWRVGTDICNILRIRTIITRNTAAKPLYSLDQFVSRVLTVPERGYFWARFGPQDQVLTKLDAVSQFLAGRFAAKEACRKACDHLEGHARGFQDIIILPITPPKPEEHQTSRPQGLILDSRPIDGGDTQLSGVQGPVMKSASTNQRLVDFDELEGQLCEISISHDGHFATAVAIVPLMMEHLSSVKARKQTEAPVSSEPIRITTRQPTDLTTDELTEPQPEGGGTQP